jgi:uncharacterized protein (TIGR02145 family)
VGRSGCYENLFENCEKYGRLYTWSVAMDSAGIFSTNGKECGRRKECASTYPVRGICPEGWHLPTMAEYETLISVVGGDSIGGRFLKSLTGWKDGGNGTEVAGFSALPAGIYQGGYVFEGRTTRFLSSTVNSTWNGLLVQSVLCMLLNAQENSVRVDGCDVEERFSVRCLQD